ncbi:MAG: hypothetical protein K940chlam3_01149 [Chlamydiae bacterium]|nr:hypothetical protein [Chlamydiota bacterium]
MEPTIDVKGKFKELYATCDEMKASVEGYFIEANLNPSAIGRAILWFRNPQNKLIIQVDRICTEVLRLNEEHGYSEDQKTFVFRGTHNILNSFAEIYSLIYEGSPLSKLSDKLKEVTNVISQAVTPAEEVELVTLEPINTSGLISDTHFGLDQTYESDGSGNIDYSHVNSDSAFAFVADGAGHNRSDVKVAQTPIFEQFCLSYPKRLSDTGLGSLEEAREFVEKQIKNLGRRINQTSYTDRHGLEKDLSDRDPAISFVQVVEFDEQKYLLTAQLADCMLLVRHADGKIETLYKTGENYNAGLGRAISSETYYYPTVEVHKIEPGTEVFGFSDGIGEFLTLDELNSVIEENTDRGHLLHELKDLIMKKGIEFDEANGLMEAGKYEKREKRMEKWDERPVNGEKTLKYWVLEDAQFHDDISSFSFKVN